MARFHQRTGISREREVPGQSAWRVIGVSAFLGFGVLLGCRPPENANPGGMPPMPVVVTTAQQRSVAERLSLVANLQANEMVEVMAQVDGIVEAIHFDEGQDVDQGDLLVELDETKFAAAVAEAEASFELREADFARARHLLDDQLISQQEFDQAASSFRLTAATLELMQRRLKDARIVAPFAGTLGSRNVSPGQVINRNTTLTWLVDLDVVKVEMDVPEKFLGQVLIGQQIEFFVAAYPGKQFVGQIYFISPYVDPNTRTALVKARLGNPGHLLKPGMLVTLELILTVREDSVVIPEAAVAQVLDEGRAMVYVVGTSNLAELKSVQLGVRLPGEVEVLSGLTGGEQVIVEGIQKIAPGASVVPSPMKPVASPPGIGEVPDGFDLGDSEVEVNNG